MARQAKRLTKTILDGLQRNAKADPAFTAYVADAGQPGLYAWARRGQVRFVFAYRPAASGRRHRLNIDTYGAITLCRARRIAEEWRGMVAAGKDQRAEVRARARDAVILADAAREYLEDLRERAETGARRGRRSGYASAKHRLERHVLPRLGGVRLKEVTVEQVRRLHRAMKATPVEANRTLGALSAVFGYAERSELVSPGFNPVRHVERFAEKGERRALTPDELVALGEAIGAAPVGSSMSQSSVRF